MALTNRQPGQVVYSRDISSYARVLPSWVYSKWVRMAIVLGVLLATILLAWLSTKTNPRYVAVLGTLPFLFVGFVYLLRFSHLYPLIILLAGMFIPFSLPTGTNSRLVISLLVAIAFTAAWILKMLIDDRKIALLPSPVNKPIIGFIAVTILSIPWSILFRDPEVFVYARFLFVQIGAGIVMVILPITYLMMGNLIQDIKYIKIIVAIMLLAGSVGLVSEIAGFYIPVNMRGMFSLWVVALSYSMGLFNRYLNPYLRAGLVLLAVAWLGWNIGWNISWLAGWLPPLVAMLVLSFIKSRKLLLVVLLMLLLFVVLDMEYIQNAFLAERTESGETRLAAWGLNWTITREHLLFGTGPGGYAIYYESYYPLNSMATHSNYIDMLAQVGVFGFAFFGWFFASHTWMGYRLVRQVEQREDYHQALINAAFAGTLACLVIMGFGDWVFPFAYTQTIAGFDYAIYNWLFMGILLFYYQRSEYIKIPASSQKSFT